MDKTAVFMDGGYLAKLTKNVFPGDGGRPRRLNFADLSRILASERGCELLRTYFYFCPPYQSPYPNGEEKRRKENYDKLVYNLRQLKRFQVREGRLSKVYDEERKPDFIQKGVDVLLAIDMMKLVLKGAIQRVILIACDSDFVPVVRAIREEGVVVELYHASSAGQDYSASRYLQDEVDEVFGLTERHLEGAKC